MRKNGADRDTALPIIGKLKGDGTLRFIELSALHLHRHGPAIILLQGWFWIKGVNLGNTSRHVTENNAFCLRSVVGFCGELTLA